MKYFVAERKPTEKNMKNATHKARADVETILEHLDYERVCIVIPFKGRQTLMKSLREIWNNNQIWRDRLAHLKAGDELLIQFPILSKQPFIFNLFKALQRRGVKLTILLHDLESLRHLNGQLSWRRRLRLYIEEKFILGQADKLIVHNMAMRQYLLAKGIAEKNMVVLEIFDYLQEKALAIKPKKKSHDVVIAGNLDPSKVGYLKDIAQVTGVTFQLFGAHYQPGSSTDNVCYHGAFMPEDLPKHLTGSFGLVWDGDEIGTCTGVYGDYLKYNNPHKTSLYLSMGFPVIIWEEAALADFVTQHHLGLTVKSLSEIAEKIDALSDEAYQAMLTNVEEVAHLLRQGKFLENAVKAEQGGDYGSY